jgi:hypothetical protein
MPRCVGAASKQRAVFLKSACEDEALRCEVELLLATSLLRVHGRPYGSWSPLRRSHLAYRKAFPHWRLHGVRPLAVKPAFRRLASKRRPRGLPPCISHYQCGLH